MGGGGYNFPSALLCTVTMRSAYFLTCVRFHLLACSTYSPIHLFTYSPAHIHTYTGGERGGDAAGDGGRSRRF